MPGPILHATVGGLLALVPCNVKYVVPIVVASIIPDIDYVFGSFAHRKFTHSVFMVLALFIVSLLSTKNARFSAFIAMAIASHILLDIMQGPTGGGVMLFYPLSCATVSSPVTIIDVAYCFDSVRCVYDNMVNILYESAIAVTAYVVCRLIYK